MGRRNQHSRDELRQMALAAAVDILNEDGPAALSTRQIAKRIGYTVGSLYLIFDNLDDLVTHVNGQTLVELRERSVEAAHSAQSPEDQLLELGKAYLAFARSTHGRWLLLFRARSGDAPLPQWYVQRVRELFALVEDCLRPLAPNAPTRERSIGARALWSGVHGVTILGLTDVIDVGDGPSDVDAIAESLIRHYVHGYALRFGAQ